MVDDWITGTVADPMRVGLATGAGSLERYEKASATAFAALAWPEQPVGGTQKR
jgi:hypothetical protein